MKKLFITLTFTQVFVCLFAQTDDVEAEIRKMEQMEVKAILAKDTVTLLKLWDAGYIVNSPDNVIVFPGKTTLDRPVLKRARTSFTRQVEQVIVREGVVISMGSETVEPAGDQPNAGQTIVRRYTNIWMLKDRQWKLVARHANISCQQAVAK